MADDPKLHAVGPRAVMAEHLNEPLLIEMLICPLMWYGNARENDMDFGQFCIMFRACYLEGFGRPFKGVRVILEESGPPVPGPRRRTETAQRSLAGSMLRTVEATRCRVLDNGTELTGNRILSSAGNVETMRIV